MGHLSAQQATERVKIAEMPIKTNAKNSFGIAKNGAVTAHKPQPRRYFNVFYGYLCRNGCAGVYSNGNFGGAIGKVEYNIYNV